MLAAQAGSAQMVDDMVQFVRTACQARLFVQKKARMTVSAAKPCTRALCMILAVMLAVAKLLHACRETLDKL